MTTETPVIDREAVKAAREAEKQAAFRRVAQRRTNAVLKQVELLLRTANTSNYSYTPEQAEIVTTAIRSAADRVEAAFAGASKTDTTVEL